LRSSRNGDSFSTRGNNFEKSSSLTEGFRERTFTDLIPAIMDEDFVLSESMAILEYLYENYSAINRIPFFQKTPKTEPGSYAVEAGIAPD